MAIRRDLPPLDLLTSFEAAARLASFTLAAVELHLTQSAVSRRIQALEEALGVTLFERHHRRIVLSPAGESYARTVTSVLASLREATRAIVASAATQTLTVAATLSFASLWLVPRLGRFQAIHPDIDVRVAASNRLEDLDRGGIDVAIRYCPAALAGRDAWRLFGESVLPVASPKLIKKSLANASDVRRYPLLHLDDSALQWPWLQWPVWLEVHGATVPTASGGLRFSHYDQMIQAAIEGQGVALGRRPLVDAALANGKLIAPFDRRFVARTGESRAYYALTSQAARSRAPVQGFLAWLRDEVDAATTHKA